jgi:hypothetical protein
VLLWKKVKIFSSTKHRNEIQEGFLLTDATREIKPEETVLLIPG